MVSEKGIRKMKAIFFYKVKDYTYGDDIDWKDEESDEWIDDEDDEENGFYAEKFTIDRTIILDEKEFEALLEHPLEESKEIKRLNLEIERSVNVNPCMLFRCKEHKLGLLVRTDGFGYVRYGALVNADSLR